jgi:hypothetical protein
MTQLSPCCQLKSAGGTKAAARRGSLICLFILGTGFLVVPAHGQAPGGKPPADQPDHSCTLNAGGGIAEPAGKETSNFSRGWNFDAGLGVRAARGHSLSLFLTANFMFDQLDVKPAALQEARILNPTNVGLLEATSGKAKFYSTTFDPTLRFPNHGPLNAYLFAGFGWFRRDLEFTSASAQSLLQPASPLVFGSGGNSGAYDFGGGVNYNLPWPKGLMLYAEVRVLHGLAINNASWLVPVSVGVRW